MSRGLGGMQREILETLDEAKQASPRYRGGRDASYFSIRKTTLANPAYAHLHGRYADDTPGRVVRAGVEWKMPADVYDLRASLRFMAERHGKLACDWLGDGPFVIDRYRTSFSRAVRRLVEDGYLVPYDRHARQRIIVRRGTPSV